MDPQSENPLAARSGVTAKRAGSGPDPATGAYRTLSPAIARVLERRPVDVEVRKRPIQARGTATFDAILDATARLLEEAGHEVITTNLVAEVAGVNIATLYQYFPSKEAILLALFRRDTDIRIAAGEAPVEQAIGTATGARWSAGRSTSWCRCAADRSARPRCGGPCGHSRSCRPTNGRP